MKKIFLIFAFASLACAQSSDVNKARNLLDTLYKYTIFSEKTLDYGNKRETSKYFSSDMVELLYLEDKCKIETRELCRLDYDFLCSCQDYTEDFSIKFETKSTKPIQILVKTIDRGDYNKNEILFTFTKENGMLKISDIIDGDSLKEILSKYYN
jgi:hypothetical protein